MSRLGLRTYAGIRDLARRRFKAIMCGRELSAFSIVALTIALIFGGLVGCGPVEAPPVEVPELTPTPVTPMAVEVASPTPASVPTPEQPLAARVNGQPIFLADYEKQVAQFEAALSDQERDLNSEEGQAALAQIRRHSCTSHNPIIFFQGKQPPPAPP